MNKIAVVTGASSGLGLAIAQRLKTEGYKVVAISRTEPLDLDYDTWLSWDLARPELLTHDLIERELGGDITVFVANAGILKGVSPAKYTYDDIRLTQDVNVNSHVLLTNYIAEKMKLSGKGRVVFIGSTAAEAGHPDVMYAATKAALAGLARSYANIYRKDNVTFNCLQFGAMKTKITKSMSQENREYLIERTLIAGPYLDIDEAVDVVMELTNDNNRITGDCMILGNNAVWK